MWWLIGYIAIAVVLVVPFQRLIMSVDFTSDSDREDRAMAWTFAVMCAAFWPIIGAGLLAIKTSKAIWNRFSPEDEESRHG